MLRKKRYAVPSIGQHDTFVGANSLQRDNFIKPIRCPDFEMRRAGLKPKTWLEGNWQLEDLFVLARRRRVGSKSNSNSLNATSSSKNLASN
jgi:hypothetical protein